MNKKITVAAALLLLSFTGGYTMTSERPVFKNGVLHFDYNADDVIKAEKLARVQLEKDLAAFVAIPKEQRTWENTIMGYGDIFEKYGDVFDTPMFLIYVSPDKDMRDKMSAFEAEISAYMVEIGTRKDIYNAIKDYADTNPSLGVPEAKLLEEMMKGFKKSGLHLPDDQLEIYKKISTRRSELAINFSKNIRDNNDFEAVSLEQLEGLPQDYINRLAKTEDGKYKVTLAYPDYVPFMQNSTSDEARQALEYKYSRRGGEENVKILEESLKLRQETAKLLGYKTYADMRLEDRMAKNPKNVDNFLADLEKKLKPFGKKETKELMRYKEEKTSQKVKQLFPWESAFWSNKYLKENYEIDAEQIKEYFPTDVVISGMFETFGNLFGIKFEAANIPVWHKDVKSFKVLDKETGALQAYIYMDMFPREGKYTHAACFGLVSGEEKKDGSYQTPFTAIVANFNPPSKDNPSLLKHSEVETLFHEFGHVLHNSLTKAKFAGLAGTSVAHDFVEVPSQILENWAWSPSVLKRISKHYKTGESLPDALISKMIKARPYSGGIYGPANFYLRQNFFAQYDMFLHENTKAVDTTKTYFKMRKEISGVESSPGTVPQASFDHIMGGYSAGYYGYLWSKVIAEDFFSVFEKNGIDNPETGKKFRDEILAVGGVYDEEKITEQFLGRKVDNKPFLKSIGLK